MKFETVWLLLDSFGLLAVAGVLIMQAQNDNQPEATPPEPTLKTRIFEMLDHALQNDYDVRNWTVEDIVTDLHAFGNAEFVESDEEIASFVILWKAARRDMIA